MNIAMKNLIKEVYDYIFRSTQPFSLDRKILLCGWFKKGGRRVYLKSDYILIYWIFLASVLIFFAWLLVVFFIGAADVVHNLFFL